MHEDLRAVVDLHHAFMEELDKGVIGLEDVKLKTMDAFWAEIPTTLSAKKERRVNAGLVSYKGVPGIGKTYLGIVIAACTDTVFVRIQGVADMMPSDILGAMVFNPKTGEFETKAGPIVKAQILLIDEGTRIPPKTQSALLEANQDKTVTIGDTTFELSDFYFVIMTSNPVDVGGGTYPLEAANADRYSMEIEVGYLSPNEEQSLVSFDFKNIEIKKLVEWQRVVALRSVIKSKVRLSSYLEEYITRIVRASRPFATQKLEDAKTSPSALVEEFVKLGAGPRADICWGPIAKAHALLSDSRDEVYPEDIQNLARNILGHRLFLKGTAKSSNITVDSVIKDIIDSVPIP